MFKRGSNENLYVEISTRMASIIAHQIDHISNLREDQVADDMILKVGQGKDEPVDVVDMSLRDAVKLIRGKKGTEVRLTIKKPNGLIKVVPIVRDVVEIEDSYAKGTILEMSPTNTKIGYINIPKFYRDFNDRAGRNVTDDTRREIEKLNKGFLN
jgi:carboxyl-terminal processing protease